MMNNYKLAEKLRGLGTACYDRLASKVERCGKDVGRFYAENKKLPFNGGIKPCAVKRIESILAEEDEDPGPRWFGSELLRAA